MNKILNYLKIYLIDVKIIYIYNFIYLIFVPIKKAPKSTGGLIMDIVLFRN